MFYGKKNLLSGHQYQILSGVTFITHALKKKIVFYINILQFQ